MLERINQVNDIKKLVPEEYPILANEIRCFLLEHISENGGHLGSNLGTVELTMALHLALDLPKDKIIFDVGHQSYTHKILTGRKDGFKNLRQFGGGSGFPRPNEDETDLVIGGHSSTSISSALGFATARELKGTDETIVAVIGDGALSGGMAYEALNNVGRLKKNFIIILNDNNMSISENVGNMSRYLNQLRVGHAYNDLKENVKKTLMSIPKIGPELTERIKRYKNGIKQIVLPPGMWFEEMGLTYIGPIDGHDIKRLKETIEAVKEIDEPIVLHVVTKKGFGYPIAEKYPEKFHGVSPFELETGKAKKKKEKADYTDVFSSKLVKLAKENEKIVAISAAMPSGTGLNRFQEEYPNKFFDVGIAEEHAVTFAGGLAAAGMKPVVAVYSTFLQRAYDQMIHDICIQKLPVVLAVDRSGLVGADGETHQGIFDTSFLTSIPNMTVMAPKNRYELAKMLEFAVEYYDGPLAIKYPRGTAYTGLKEHLAPIEIGKSEVIKTGDHTVAILAVGSMVEEAVKTVDYLGERGINATLVNVRFVSPIDKQCILEQAKSHALLVTMEETVEQGSFGQKVATLLMKEELGKEGVKCQFMNFGIPDTFVSHGAPNVLKEHLGLTGDSMGEKIANKIKTMR